MTSFYFLMFNVSSLIYNLLYNNYILKYHIIFRYSAEEMHALVELKPEKKEDD